MIGFVKGDALSEDNSALVDDFIAELADGLNLWTGPMNLQDGTEFLADGEVATDTQVWYLPQLLEGMLGLSSALNRLTKQHKKGRIPGRSFP